MITTRSARRASGTKNSSDFLLALTFVRRRTPEKDAADLAKGQVFELASLSKTIGGVALISVGKGKQIERLKIGSLFVAQGQPMIWRERRTGNETLLNGPFRLMPLEKKVPLNNRMGFFELSTADGTHELTLPKKDAPLVELAIAAEPAATV
ncbi:hypothetical protein ABZ883_11175 [Streptomyces sp. NPDC046977]|uniref:hypothetical protein n=1 Tax=Streptomyces sp. NPDC046977 TaxID=3154703 RepID=UPI0033ED2F0A